MLLQKLTVDSLEFFAEKAKLNTLPAAQIGLPNTLLNFTRVAEISKFTTEWRWQASGLGSTVHNTEFTI